MTAPITRKAFCGALAGTTVALLFQACGGGGGDDSGGPAPAPAPGPAPAPAPPPAVMGCTDTIGDNHGHELIVAVADLDSPTDKVYNIQGVAIHNHTVRLTVAQLASLKAGSTVNVTTSTTEFHDHRVTISCV